MTTTPATRKAARKPAATKAPAAKPRTRKTPEAAATREARTTPDCRCGCDAPTRRPEARYLPGHDARHAGEVGRSLVGLNAAEAEARLAVLETPALQAKARRVADTAARKEARREAAATARAAAKAAYRRTLADATDAA